MKIQLCIDAKLQELGKSRYWLAQESHTHYNIIDKYCKNKIFRYDSDVLLRICTALQCEPGDIIKLVNGQ